ncbi:hypothetical protein [Paenibacillus eucommiae]|uniref:DNA-directed RNA polymerase subunit K/omega n=1 Tax=Paenibacillus eucommiae TaxID=1355755 RepID=A0ABS4J5V5_9BACL|nr:hypothetical protein [Paenibacillus eucommiae]MBP1995227.1 DNA-directed RNA polymerase subunit K/omega [Paenibacillus eucommiae]
MKFTSHDITIIERALRIAMKSEKIGHRKDDYHEVLLKLQESAKQVIERERDAESNEGKVQDGIRYDYDDSSDLI